METKESKAVNGSGDVVVSGHEYTHPLYRTHVLNEQGLAKAKMLAEEFTKFTQWLQHECLHVHDTREWSIVQTKLEEACFFAKKTLATNPTNQKEG